MPASIPGNDHRLDPVANLEQGFKQDMVLVIVGNQHVVNRFRKIEVGVAGDTVFVGVAQDGIKQTCSRHQIQ